MATDCGPILITLPTGPNSTRLRFVQFTPVVPNCSRSHVINYTNLKVSNCSYCELMANWLSKGGLLIALFTVPVVLLLYTVNSSFVRDLPLL